MNILFTGASSFTGMHIVQALTEQGHHVICTFTQSLDAYDGIRKQRILRILPSINPIWNTLFGDASFLATIHRYPIDTYAHHMAWTKGYNTPHYDRTTAVANNTHNLITVLQALERKNCQQIILTGSVFEGEHVDCRQGNAPFEKHG